eukprot:gene13199-13305_t
MLGMVAAGGQSCPGHGLRDVNLTVQACLNCDWATVQRMTGSFRNAKGGTAYRSWLAVSLAFAAAILAQSAQARPAAIAPGAADSDGSGEEADALPYQQCVPFARVSSGIQLYGDALTWWDQAQGHYARGREPRVGAVMSFRPYRAMALGHVATVSRIIDSRTVLLRHANWSPIDGRRGQVEMDVRAVDVSPDNSWSEVRVWYAPIGDLGTTHWPVNGFIYNRRPRAGEGMLLASANPAPANPALANPVSAALTRASASHAVHGGVIDAAFLAGITPERGAITPQDTALRQDRATMARTAPAPRTLLAAPAPARGSLAAYAAPSLRNDPIGRIIAARMK